MSSIREKLEHGMFDYTQKLDEMEVKVFEVLGKLDDLGIDAEFIDLNHDGVTTWIQYKIRGGSVSVGYETLFITLYTDDLRISTMMDDSERMERAIKALAVYNAGGRWND